MPPRPTLPQPNALVKLVHSMIVLGMEYFGRYYGTYRGTISDINDPEGYGRVRLIIPMLTNDKEFKYWAYPRGVYCGKGYGSQIPPQKGDHVFIAFEFGDPSYPTWEFSHYGKKDNEKEKPKDFDALTTFGFITPAGNKILIEDKEGEESIKVYQKDGFIIFINKDGIFEGKDDTQKQPAVLGDTNEDCLEELRAIIEDLNTTLSSIGTADSAAAATAGLSYATTLTTFTQTLTPRLAALNQKIPTTKSQNNYLD